MNIFSVFKTIGTQIVVTVGILGLFIYGGIDLYTTVGKNRIGLENAINAEVVMSGRCSGTVIEDPDLTDGIQFTVLSAKHCIEPTETVGSPLDILVPNVENNVLIDYRTIKVEIKAISPSSDLVLLQGGDDGLDITPVKIAIENPETTDYVFNISYPLLEGREIMAGYLSYIYKTQGFEDISKSGLYQLVGISVAPGSSGSGLFKRGELIGVLTGMMSRAQYISFFVPLSEIQVFIKENSNNVS